PVEPHPNARFCGRLKITGLVCRFFGGPTCTRRVGPLPTGQAGRDQDQTLDEIGAVKSELERHATSEGVAYDDGLAFEQRLHVANVRERPRLQPMLAEPAEIGRDYPISACVQQL